MSYQDKYLKYKNKYLELKSIIQSGGAQPEAGAATIAGVLWKPELPPRAKIGDHIQETSGKYLGHIVKVLEYRLILNTGLYVDSPEQNMFWIPITLPDGVQIIDERPNPVNLENGPWEKVEYSPVLNFENMIGSYVVGRNGQYWGRIYRPTGYAFYLIDGNPPPGRIAKYETIYGNPMGDPGGIHVKWYKLKFPAGVKLEDNRIPAREYGPEAVALPGPIPLPPPPPAPLPINVSECGVCFGDKNYNIGGEDPLRVVVLPCGHTFHKGCVNPWIATRHECPTCRAPARVASNLMLGGGLYSY